MDNTRRKNPHLDRTLITPLAVKPHQSVCSLLHLDFKPDLTFCSNEFPPQTTRSIPHKWRETRGTARSFLTVATHSKSKRWDSDYYAFLLIFPPGHLPHICQQRRRRTGQAASFWGDFSYFWEAPGGRYRWNVGRCLIWPSFPGARSDHLRGRHATSLCNDCRRPSQEFLLQKALLS